MNAQILDGKLVANKILDKISNQVDIITASALPVPKLVVLLIGDNNAAKLYVANKQKACRRVGIESELINLAANISEKELLDIIAKLNTNNAVTGILVQLPLPDHIDANKIITAVNIKKDVDGFHPTNMGHLVQNNAVLSPCTPRGIMALLNHYRLDLQGLDAVIVGRSNIVGKPMALELINAGCTVTVCNSHTKNLAKKVAQADLLVVAVGKANFIKGSWIKPGSIAIDVGINRIADTSLTGDIEYTEAITRAAWITPVPGGVGPLTVATLLSNTMVAYA
ncbi:MAG: bifunctional methylenetetrahydrofolate dehydrogenase/methenyltetrahydrofolate cyclohydrolase FolD [Legionellales bacterium]|nr:MAG: bifunctional methylenetetrahydrofolate dehydrogenase/methenyltetrahydrofolate cyclohydrolase FolD [Legionellales bacterium]